MTEQPDEELERDSRWEKVYAQIGPSRVSEDHREIRLETEVFAPALGREQVLIFTYRGRVEEINALLDYVVEEMDKEVSKISPIENS